MGNQWIECWAALGGEYLGHGLGIGGVRTQTINGFGAERDKAPSRNDIGGGSNIPFIARNDGGGVWHNSGCGFGHAGAAGDEERIAKTWLAVL